MKLLFMLCNSCMSMVRQSKNWLVDHQNCTCIFLEEAPTQHWDVQYAELFTGKPSGSFMVTADNEAEAKSKINKILMAKSKELGIDAMRVTSTLRDK